MTSVVMRVPGADATGVIVTVNQLALVVGVATFGTLYLNLAGRLPQGAARGFRLESAHATAVTCAVLAAGAVAGGILTVLPRPRYALTTAGHGSRAASRRSPAPHPEGSPWITGTAAKPSLFVAG